MKHIKLIVFLGALSIFNLTSIPDRIASNYLDDALTVSATAYIAARGINATISVIQDIDFSIGVMSGSPGELLDPLNDLIERFSSVMLFTTASLGIQKIMLKISGWLVFKALIVGVFLLLIVHFFYKEKFSIISSKNMVFFYKALIFSLVLRFSVPFMAIASGIVENTFINDEVNSHIVELQKVNQSTEKLSELEDNMNSHEGKSNDQNTGVQEFDPSILGFLKYSTESLLSSVSDATSNLNPKRKIEAEIEVIKKQLSESISSTINLIALFVVQSILLPIVFLYIILFSAKGLYRYEFSTD